MGKGSKRRPGKPGAYQNGFDSIDWSKGRPTTPSAPSSKPIVTDILVKDYMTKSDWVIPPLSELYLTKQP